jgi:hypothetical protein
MQGNYPGKFAKKSRWLTFRITVTLCSIIIGPPLARSGIAPRDRSEAIQERGRSKGAAIVSAPRNAALAPGEAGAAIASSIDRRIASTTARQ